jgi:hypothetical protein
LTFIVDSATYNRQQGYKAERRPKGKVFKKGKRREMIFNYEYLRHDAFEAKQKIYIKL